MEKKAKNAMVITGVRESRTVQEAAAGREGAPGGAAGAALGALGNGWPPPAQQPAAEGASRAPQGLRLRAHRAGTQEVCEAASLAAHPSRSTTAPASKLGAMCMMRYQNVLL